MAVAHARRSLSHRVDAHLTPVHGGHQSSIELLKTLDGVVCALTQRVLLRQASDAQAERFVVEHPRDGVREMSPVSDWH